jgi:hypothetical protein
VQSNSKRSQDGHYQHMPRQHLQPSSRESEEADLYGQFDIENQGGLQQQHNSRESEEDMASSFFQEIIENQAMEAEEGEYYWDQYMEEWSEQQTQQMTQIQIQQRSQHLLAQTMVQIRECTFSHKPSASKRFHIMALFAPKGSWPDKEIDNETEEVLIANIAHKNRWKRWQLLLSFARSRAPEQLGVELRYNLAIFA